MMIVIILISLTFGVSLYVDYQKNQNKIEVKNKKIVKKEYNKDLFKKILLNIEDNQNNNLKGDNLNKKVDNLFIAKSIGVFLIDEKEDLIKTLYLKNPNKKLSLASITKIMTAIIALEEMDNRKIKITKYDLKEYGDNGLIENEVFSIKNLIKFMLMVSSNDAARAIAMSYNNTENSRNDFINEMNKKADELKMEHTLFFSESGLDTTNNVGGAYSTILDLKKMIYYFYKNYSNISKYTSVFERTINSDKKNHILINTNKLLKSDIYNRYIFSKTGYTDLTGGNLVTIYSANNRYKIMIIVIGSTKKGRFLDVNTIVHNIPEYLKKI